MARDIRVPVLLTAEEFLALRNMADEDGDSQSGLFRRLLRKEARHRALSLAHEHERESAERGHVLRSDLD